MKISAFWPLPVAVLLSACGGAGESSSPSIPVVDAPSPTPTPSPTPSPPPTSVGSQPTLLNLTTDTNLLGYSGSNGYYRAKDGSVTFTEEYGTSQSIPVRYNANSKKFIYTSYQYLLPNFQSGPADLVPDRSASNSSFSVSKGQSSGILSSFTQLTPGGSNKLLPLLYCSLAIARAQYFNSDTGITMYGVTPMSFGLAFDRQATSLTGGATYTGIILGSARGVGSHVYDLSGTIEIALNYDTTAFTGRIRLTGKDDVTGETVNLGTFELNQARPRGILDSLSAETANQGQFQGMLAGPRGEELMGGFDAKVPDPRTPSTTLKIAVAMVARR